MTIGNAIERIQELLAGLNYAVSLTIERIGVGVDCEPADVIAKAFPNASFCDLAPCTAEHARRTLTHSLMYQGDYSHGPDNGVLDSEEFLRLLAIVRDHFTVELRSAYDIHKFRLTEGNPHYPVFWGFSFMLRFDDYSNIWIGSSSD